jgi:hypothetical protein
VERWNAVNRIENREGLVGRGLLRLAVLALGVGMLAPAVLADDAAQPGRAVRLSSVDGQVQISQGDDVIADRAVANAPLFEGSRVTTAEDGRAEIQFEDGSVARLTPNSSVTLKVLSGQGETGEAEIQLLSGLGYFEIRGGGQAGAARIRFGDSVLTTSGFTVLRINFDSPPGELAVFSGNAHLERGNRLTVDLSGGESLSLSGGDGTHYDQTESIEPDSWDSWNSDRDQMLTAEAASKTGVTKDYADNSNPAWNDLDANGSWYNVPGQGNIWSPYAAANAGWDPYGSGYWMWTPRFGYLWVSSNSWGYLPYQCGDWNYYDSFGWGWSPGMGGCSPWWGGGGYLGPNIGIGFGGYRPPQPPHPRPHQPIHWGGLVATSPMVAVNRRPVAGSSMLPLPARDGRSPVVIAGQTVRPMRALNPRVPYGPSIAASLNRMDYPGTIIGAKTTDRPNYEPNRTSNPSSATGSYRARPAGGSSPPAPPASRAPSGGVPASPPSGGAGFPGGGGASHAGGAGGGGSHR